MRGAAPRAPDTVNPGTIVQGGVLEARCERFTTHLQTSARRLLGRDGAVDSFVRTHDLMVQEKTIAPPALPETRYASLWSN